MFGNALWIFLVSLFMSADDFSVGAAYGLQKKIIPLKSMTALVLSSTVTMFISMEFGRFLFGLAGEDLSKYLSMILLCGLGGWQLYKIWRRNHDTGFNKKIALELTDSVNFWESLYLGAALGVDDFAEAVGLAAAKFPVALTVVFFKISEVLMILAGVYLGYKGRSIHKLNQRLKYIPGIILVLVGIKQIF